MLSESLSQRTLHWMQGHRRKCQAKSFAQVRTVRHPLHKRKKQTVQHHSLKRQRQQQQQRQLPELQAAVQQHEVQQPPPQQLAKPEIAAVWEPKPEQQGPVRGASEQSQQGAGPAVVPLASLCEPGTLKGCGSCTVMMHSYNFVILQTQIQMPWNWRMSLC